MSLTHNQAVRTMNFCATFDSVNSEDVKDYMERIKERHARGDATIDDVLMFCVDKITKTCASRSYKNMKAILENTEDLVMIDADERARIAAMAAENEALKAEVARLSAFDPRDKDGNLKCAVPFVQE